MKPALALLLVIPAVVPPADVTEDQLAPKLLDYFVGRVDEAHRHETADESVERMGWIAAGVVAACREEPLDPELGWTFNRCVAIGTTTAKWESALLREVHSGEKRGSSGERCLFQLHRAVSDVPDPKYRITPEELAATTGLNAEATAQCARAGVRALAWHVHRCRLRADDYVAPARLFAEYHLPSINCREHLTRMNSLRASSYRHLLRELETAE